MLHSPSPDEAPLRFSQKLLLHLSHGLVDGIHDITEIGIKSAVKVAAVSGDWSTVRTLISRKVGLRIVRDSMVPA